MAKKKEEKGSSNKLWGGIDIVKDFEEGIQNAENADIGEFNREKMIIFSANVNYARQLTRLSDSLKPVERRILYTMYMQGLKPPNKKKSVSIQGATTEIHPHGGASIYATMIGMSQYWKRQIPLVRVYGQAGTEVSAIYAADRYTEAHMSQYAWDCFFKDFDPDCAIMMFSTSGNRDEPVSLPSRYPNVLINGGEGIAVGNSFRIPPFNVGDVIEETKKMLYNDTGSNVYMVPDLPTGCDIVDDGTSIKTICETGRGVLRMRARTEIIDEGKHWAIRVTNLPWMVTQESVVNAIVKLTKNGQIPVKDVQDRHEQEILPDGKTVVSHVDLYILVDKAHDPYAVREKLFMKTQMQSSVSINFKVVMEGLEIDTLSLGDLIRHWIEERREYKRRLLNKRITKTTARINLLKVLIEMCTGDNLKVTTDIIRKSSESDISKNLIKQYGMSSYQADRIAEMRLGAFNKDALVRYKKELKERKEELDNLYKMVKSEKTIDDIIASELDELKKYVQPRKSQVINLDRGQTVDTETEYFLLATKRGCVKKVSLAAVERSKRGFGSFESKDYPTHVLRVKNMDSVIFVDGFGKFSVIKVGDIDAMALTDMPHKAYEYTKLEGEIISMQYFQGTDAQRWLKKAKASEMFMVCLSRDGFAKKIPLKDIIDMTDDGRKVVKNMKLTKLRPHDFLTHADYYLADTAILFYTKQANYNFVHVDNVPIFGKEAVGNQMVKLEGEDYCVGCCAINPEAHFIVMVTEKGCVKKSEIEFLGKPSATKATSYLATLDANDSLIYADTPLKSIDVCTRLGHIELTLDEIKTLSRKAKPVRKVQLASGDNIIRVVTH
jgi:DNA gyrase/topoisomerase IV subunit A